MRARGWALLRAVFLPVSVAILVLAALSVPLPFYVEGPGTPLSLAESIAVEQEQGDLRGDFLVTTVNLRNGTVARVAGALLDADSVLIRSQLIVPPGQDEQEHFDRQRQVFRQSVDVAAAVGLAAAGLEVDPSDIQGEGVLVSRVLAGAPADGVLRPGDVITAIGGRDILVADELRERLEEAGDEVEVRYRRDEEVRLTRIAPADIRTRGETFRGIGVEIQTANPRIQLPVGVEVESGRIGGPSAGLMMALTIYDLVAEEDLADGRVIAGTGTLSPDGRVGPIGGVAQKVASAHAAGAEVFVSPAPQLEAALAAVPAGSDLVVVGAASFDEALEALRAGR